MQSPLERIANESRPEPNAAGNFQCHECPGWTKEAYYDSKKHTLSYECPEGHKSIIEDFYA